LIKFYSTASDTSLIQPNPINKKLKMSFLIQRAPIRSQVLRGIRSSNAGIRSFTASSTRALKESDRHTDGLAEKNEHHKQDTIAKAKAGKGHWKPELASDSEEAVNADRAHKGETPEEMQKKTASHAEEKHKAGTSQHDGFGGN